MSDETDEVRRVIERELCERSFFFFCKWVFKRVYRKQFVENKHHETLCQIMEKVYAGELKRIIINIPPRYSKTEIVVILFIAWTYAKNSKCNNLHVSYSDQLALRNSSMARGVIESEEFQNLWPIQFSRSQKSKRQWMNLDGGETYSVSSGGAVTGFGAGLKGSDEYSGAILIDDPLKADAENSELQLDTVIRNYENVIASRVNDKSTPIILIMQRLHEKDLSGHLASGKSVSGEFEQFIIPAIMDREKTWYDQREEGEALWPEVHTKEKLEDMDTKNAVLYAGQYQQRPAPEEGYMVKKSDLRYYTVLPKLSFKIISCDLNFKKDGVSNACLSYYGAVSYTHLTLPTTPYV